QNNVNAAISRGFRPGFATDSFFETVQTAQTAWDSLVFYDADDTIGSPGGHRYPCITETRGGRRYAFMFTIITGY
ncbi:hypothetical protein NEUTE2DRAFT_64227, partial [Neurospora tetrasperma FGSC 2509]